MFLPCSFLCYKTLQNINLLTNISLFACLSLREKQYQQDLFFSVLNGFLVFTRTGAFIGMLNVLKAYRIIIRFFHTTQEHSMTPNRTYKQDHCLHHKDFQGKTNAKDFFSNLLQNKYKSTLVIHYKTIYKLIKLFILMLEYNMCKM